MRTTTKHKTLTGEWRGKFAFDEVIQIIQHDQYVFGVKLTGNEYVPAGAPCFFANLLTNDGWGVVAEQEFSKPHLVPGHLEVVSEELLYFCWMRGIERAKIEFRRDD